MNTLTKTNTCFCAAGVENHTQFSRYLSEIKVFETHIVKKNEKTYVL